MTKYYVELDARMYFEYEIEAENEDDAVAQAEAMADQDARDEYIDWDVWVEAIDEEDEQ